VADFIQPGEIGASLKVFAVTLDDDYADAIVTAQGACAVQKILYHVAVIGIVDMRSVERDRGDAARIDFAKYTWLLFRHFNLREIHEVYFYRPVRVWTKGVRSRLLVA